MNEVSYLKYRQWCNENTGEPGVRSTFATISEPACTLWFKDDVLMAKVIISQPSVYQMSDEAEASLCTHTFGTLNIEDGYDLIDSEDWLHRVHKACRSNITYFTYCPDCGVLLAPVIAEAIK